MSRTVLYYTLPPGRTSPTPFDYPTWNGRMMGVDDPGAADYIRRVKERGDRVFVADETRNTGEGYYRPKYRYLNIREV